MEKRFEFRCSQDRLFETVMNLANQGKWPPNWSYHDLGLRNPLGFIELQVCRERLLKRRAIPTLGGKKLDVQFYRRVGKITFAGLGEHTSALIVRSSNGALLKFFDDLVAILLKYQVSTAVSVSRPSAEAAAMPQEPPKPPEPKTVGGELRPLLDWYDQMRAAGFRCTLKEVAARSGYSYGYVKQRHAVHRSKPHGFS